MASNSGNTKAFVGIFYPLEDESHYNAIQLLENTKTDYVAIDHDSDTDDNGKLKKTHTHIYIRFSNQKTLSSAAKILGIKPNYIEPCRDTKKAMRYMVHLGCPDKYQYNWDIAYGPLKNQLGRVCGDDCEEDRVKRILDIIDSLPVTASYRDVLNEVLRQRLYSDFRRMGFILTKLMDERQGELPKGWI